MTTCTAATLKMETVKPALSRLHAQVITFNIKDTLQEKAHICHIFLSLLTNFFCADKLGCQEGSPLGSDYKGNASITVSGRTCQKWSVQTPHAHGWTDQGDHNYCRNPDGEAGAWCYTTDPDVRWELCLVPECDSLPQSGEPNFHNKTK